MSWHAIVLAASRGADDPIAKHYGLAHKCLLKIGGQSMLSRVVDALAASGVVTAIDVSIESQDVISTALGIDSTKVRQRVPAHSAPASALAAARAIGVYPILITTGDHALLTPQIVRHVCDHSVRLGADITVGLATRDVIQAEHPETRRTYFRFSDVAVSGCNLFTVHSPAGLGLLELWSELEKNRKRPWKLAFAFGASTLLRMVFGRLSLEDAFNAISRKCSLAARPLLLPFAEAAIDVDKPADKDLAEAILARRKGV